MKLFYSPASPYVRKVRVCAQETGLTARIELVHPSVSPVSPSAAVNAENPLGKIPALVRDDGAALYDSRVICEYLDSLHTGTRLFPAAGDERWRALRRQALADGILDAAVNARYETALRPRTYRWNKWVNAQREKFLRALDALEGEAAALGSRVDIGTIAVGCALGYLDFRYPDVDWRADHRALASWFGGFSQRASMRDTLPAG